MYGVFEIVHNSLAKPIPFQKQKGIVKTSLPLASGRVPGRAPKPYAPCPVEPWPGFPAGAAARPALPAAAGATRPGHPAQISVIRQN